MSSRTKSVDEPPIWKPTLIPPTEYIAGVDHLPSKFWPLRQSKGPRPPLPPIPKPNFFTLGRMSTQLAFDNEVSEMLLLLRKPCNTRLACRSVSSSFSLSPANTGRIIISIMEVRKQDKAFLLIRSLVFSDAVRNMGPLPFLFKVLHAARRGRILTTALSLRVYAEVGGLGTVNPYRATADLQRDSGAYRAVKGMWGRWRSNADSRLQMAEGSGQIVLNARSSSLMRRLNLLRGQLRDRTAEGNQHRN